VAGLCNVTSGTIRKKSNSVVWSVTGVTAAGKIYDSIANHDPDGSSNGTTITVRSP
jgi:hypothetical protein